MPDALDVHSVEVLHKLGLTEDMVRRHEFRPDRLADAALDLELHEAGEDTEAHPVDPPPSGLLYRLDVDGLRRDLEAQLSPKVSGYALQLRRYGQVLIDLRKGAARRPPDGRADAPDRVSVDWAPDVRMHVASVSKLITAMAMTKVLHSRAISPDATIARWLPKHWVRGPGVDRLTFYQLLTHTSGLVALDEPGGADYQFMKDQIAIGVAGGTGYRNMNYSLCRILLSTIDAPFLFDLLPTADDRYWDQATIAYYRRYVQENIFDPAGVTSGFLGEPGDALAYQFPANRRGQATADLTTRSGAVGWHLSIDDLLAIMASFRRLGTIVDPARAQAMLDHGFGLEPYQDSMIGRIYPKGGFWSFDDAKFVQQASVLFMPRGMELAVLANSPYGEPNVDVMHRVLGVIQQNVRLNLLTTVVAAAAGFAAVGLVRRVRARRP